jgi:hypothetical protein
MRPARKSFNAPFATSATPDGTERQSPATRQDGGRSIGNPLDAQEEGMQGGSSYPAPIWRIKNKIYTIQAKNGIRVPNGGEIGEVYGD